MEVVSERVLRVALNRHQRHAMLDFVLSVDQDQLQARIEGLTGSFFEKD